MAAQSSSRALSMARPLQRGGAADRPRRGAVPRARRQGRDDRRQARPRADANRPPLCARRLPHHRRRRRRRHGQRRRRPRSSARRPRSACCRSARSITSPRTSAFRSTSTPQSRRSSPANTKLVDVGELNGRIFINNSSIGLYPAIVQERARAPEPRHEQVGRLRARRLQRHAPRAAASTPACTPTESTTAPTGPRSSSSATMPTRRPASTSASGAGSTAASCGSAGRRAPTAPR